MWSSQAVGTCPWRARTQKGETLGPDGWTREGRIPPCPALAWCSQGDRIHPTAARVRDRAAARPSHHPPGVTVTGCRVVTSMAARVADTWIDRALVLVNVCTEQAVAI